MGERGKAARYPSLFPRTRAMKSLLIVYHSMTGGTRQMAESAAAGAATEPAITTNLKRAQDTTPEDVLSAAGYIFATPENLAAISGLMKDFFDRCYYPALDRIQGRPYAALICAGSDGQNALRQLTRITTGWRLKQISDPIITLTHAQTPESILAPKRISAPELARCHELGASIAAGIALGIF
jgi:multimeric flavodoxin WrbA